jgi:hypothetical protein
MIVQQLFFSFMAVALQLVALVVPFALTRPVAHGLILPA